LYEHTNLVETPASSYHLVEMCAYAHTLDTRTRFMYNVCIHFEIHHAQVCVHGHVGHWMLGWP